MLEPTGCKVRSQKREGLTLLWVFSLVERGTSLTQYHASREEDVLPVSAHLMTVSL